MMISEKDTILVGILNWNQKEDTLLCLESLSRVSAPKLEVLVVDNGSTDGSVEMMRSKFPSIVIHENKENRGCAGGRNDVLDYFLKGDLRYLMFLDNDAMVEPDCFAHLVEEINREPKIGAVGVKVYYWDNPRLFWSRGGARFNSWQCLFGPHGQRELDIGQYDRAVDVDSIPGGFTFLRREAAEIVPRMDERYFIYYEDSDWCFRVKQAGFRLLTSGNAKVTHKASSSLGMCSPIFFYYRTRNRLLFATDHISWIQKPIFFTYFFLWELPQSLYTLWRSGQGKQIKGVWFGIRDFFKGRWNRCVYLELC